MSKSLRELEEERDQLIADWLYEKSRVDLATAVIAITLTTVAVIIALFMVFMQEIV